MTESAGDLRNVQPCRCSFEILEAGVRADGEWWSVPVLSRLRGQDVKRDVTVSIFATVENDLHNTEGLTILLVPVVD